VENELLGREISLADAEKKQQQQQQYRRPAPPIERKRSPISPASSNDQYTSSFEEDLNTESKVSRSEEEENIQRRKSPLEGTGRFTTAAFEHQKLPRRRSPSSSSSSPTPTHSPKGIVIKPTIVVRKPSATYQEANQISDRELSVSSRSKGRPPPQQQSQRQSTGDDDDELLLSTKTGEKIYSTDFEESKSKLRSISSIHEDEDDDDDDADTMKLSARSLTKAKRSPFDSDDDDE
jgi:hypothetical protein